MITRLCLIDASFSLNCFKMQNAWVTIGETSCLKYLANDVLFLPEDLGPKGITLFQFLLQLNCPHSFPKHKLIYERRYQMHSSTHKLKLFKQSKRKLVCLRQLAAGGVECATVINHWLHSVKG